MKGLKRLDDQRVAICTTAFLALSLLLGLVLSQDLAGPVTYQTLEPILSTRCTMCHAGAGAPLGLQLDSLEGLLEGSQNGPVVVAGDPEGSEIIRRLKGISQPRMPLTGPPFLSDEEIALFEQWIAEGLPVSASEPSRDEPVTTPEPVRPAAGEPVTYAHVEAIFQTRCVKCHAAQGLMGPAPEGYRLDSYSEILASDDRLRVVPGYPEASELLRRVRGQALPRMPLDGPPYLSDKEIGLIKEWIAQGARNAEGEVATYPVGARVRLHGTLGAAMNLDGLPLVLMPDARVEDVSPGAYVEVRGNLGADGAVVVERIRGRDD